ncbi:flagellar hook-associated protein FlgL [Kurthia zopfii]|uniref:Flagellar hook-associated protein 3 FlgL n=1 Tax=Kurthia zopfii TaxID=1650 RepID=A0A8B4Q4Q2_9BACL|nr:flagellar hook-associated protein FlgL [Kurthia zopfii]PWI22655.1 flagellar hook-associated protein FlgL [Kurthia zopfii]TDR39245.1 flagellar hook-associated protein 3 FlgL [Kurthia zopfii]GEK31440.1 flagellar hook-associated protein FlgL [Kurthia zopfii]STX08787.1 Hook-filament junction protein [Kurthia zopfii]
MRITQSMLSNNMLNNLSNSYGTMGKLQQQLSSGSKLTRPSDDPVAAVKGMGYRTTLVKNDQFTRNMNEVNGWLDASDSALTQTNNALKRVKDLMVQASNDTNTDDDRKAMQKEIDQIRQQIRDVANTQQGDTYIFSGTDVRKPLFANAGAKDPLPTLQGNMSTVEVEVYDGITFGVNTPAKELFQNIDSMMNEIQQELDGGATGEGIGKMITKVQTQSDAVLKVQAGVGAKQNRVDTMMDRLSSQKISVTKQLSNNEDVEYEQAITQLITEESIHRAALSVGAKIIRPSLVDFL